MKKRSLFAFLTLGVFVAYRKFKLRSDINELVEHEAASLKKARLSKQTFAVLPRSGFLANGSPTECMNLVFVGEKSRIKEILEQSGWYEADPLTPWTLLRSACAVVTHGQYLRGPFSPVFIDDKAPELCFQKPDKDNVFAKRHHVRIWSTQLTDEGGKPIWVGLISFDKGIKYTGKWPLLIVHEVDADLDADRAFITRDMIASGAKLRDHIQLQPAIKTTTALGDKIFSDGRAAVLEVK